MKYFAILCFGLFSLQSIGQEATTTTIYLIRHAEKADGTSNPDLSEQGLIRSKNIAAYFENVPLDLIYATPYKRTQQTCSQAAAAKRKDILTYNPEAMNLRVLADANPGKTILVVGHSNTIARYINTLLQKNVYEDIPENDYGRIYKLSIQGDEVVHEMNNM